MTTRNSSPGEAKAEGKTSKPGDRTEMVQPEDGRAKELKTAAETEGPVGLTACAGTCRGSPRRTGAEDAQRPPGEALTANVPAAVRDVPVSI